MTIGDYRHPSLLDGDGIKGDMPKKREKKRVNLSIPFDREADFEDAGTKLGISRDINAKLVWKILDTGFTSLKSSGSRAFNLAVYMKKEGIDIEDVEKWIKKQE